jgi:hypothetical protein
MCKTLSLSPKTTHTHTHTHTHKNKGKERKKEKKIIVNHYVCPSKSVYYKRRKKTLNLNPRGTPNQQQNKETLRREGSDFQRYHIIASKRFNRIPQGNQRNRKVYISTSLKKTW